jgi:hypothetical protein
MGEELIGISRLGNCCEMDNGSSLNDIDSRVDETDLTPPRAGYQPP